MVLSGGKTLTIGGLNTNTIYAGLISDGGSGGGLTKVGSTVRYTSSFRAHLYRSNGCQRRRAWPHRQRRQFLRHRQQQQRAGRNTAGLTLNNGLTFNGTSGYQVQIGATATGLTTVSRSNLAVNGSPTLKLTGDGTTPPLSTTTIIHYSGSLSSSSAWTVDARATHSALPTRSRTGLTGIVLEYCRRLEPGRVWRDRQLRRREQRGPPFELVDDCTDFDDASDDRARESRGSSSPDRADHRCLINHRQ